MNTKKLTLSAVLIALGTVLSIVAVFKLPYGGSVTLASMVPVILISYIFETRWGILTGIVYALVQCVINFSAPPVQNLTSFLVVILFDYVIAFGVLGTAGSFLNILGNKKWGIAVSGGIVVILRYICHIISGIAIWSVYAPQGQSPLVYSVIYNGSYMVPELVVTVAVLALLTPMIIKTVSNFKGKKY